MKVTHVRRKVMLSALAGAIMIPGSAIRAKAADGKNENAPLLPIAGIESVLTECLETNVKENINLYLVPANEGEYLNRAYSNVNNFSYIRNAPNEESEWTGKLYEDSTVTVLQYEGDWTKIRSGNVEGYVPADALYTGEEAKKRAKEYETDVVTVLADVLNVRSGQGTENDILTQVMFRQQYEVTGEPENGWYPVKVEEFDGWVCGDYVEAETTFSYAESKEEEEQRLARGETARPVRTGREKTNRSNEDAGNYSQSDRTAIATGDQSASNKTTGARSDKTTSGRANGADRGRTGAANDAQAANNGVSGNISEAQNNGTGNAAGIQSGTGTQSGAQSGTAAETQSGNGTGAGTQPGTGTEAGTQSGTSVGDGAQSEDGTAYGTGAEAGTQPGTGTDNASASQGDGVNDTLANGTADSQTQIQNGNAAQEDGTAEVQETASMQTQEYAGQAVIDFACQFIGNPYVWGGTSLTNGADCSGFVQSVYANFGIALPRTTWDMVNVGYEVSYDQALPGDLVLYDGHVGLYMGDGTIVNAMNEAQGIGICTATYAPIITIRRVL